nr:hypothetical protein [Tanacetum cinerariifolium]
MPKVLSLAWETILEIKHALEDKHCQLEDILKLFRRLHNDAQNIHEELGVYINTSSWDRPIICYNDDEDEDYTIAVTPILSTDEPEISSGSTTTRTDISLPYYEAFYDDHVKEISSGSTTTHSDFSLYGSFIFDLSINPFPPADMSDFYHEEFADELAHIISPPKYECFSFKNEPNSRDFTMDVVEDTFPTREPKA